MHAEKILILAGYHSERVNFDDGNEIFEFGPISTFLIKNHHSKYNHTGF